MTDTTQKPPSPLPASGKKPVLRAVPVSSPKVAPQGGIQPANTPAPAPGPKAQIKPRTDNRPKPQPQDAPPEVGSLLEGAAARIQHRASLIATLAALKGSDVPISDVAAFLWKETPGDLSLHTLAKAVQASGLQPKILEKQFLAPALWPALAIMDDLDSVIDDTRAFAAKASPNLLQ